MTTTSNAVDIGREAVIERANAAYFPADTRDMLLALRDALDRAQGIKPELPPMPPDGTGAPRYGLRWNGPQEPLAVPMDDGYWTPWHLAQATITRQQHDLSVISETLNRKVEALAKAQRAIERKDAALDEADKHVYAYYYGLAMNEDNNVAETRLLGIIRQAIKYTGAAP